MFMRRPAFRVLVAACALLFVAAPGPAGAAEADNVRRARQHFQDGKKAFEARDYPGALREFQAGYQLEPRPGFLLNMGHAARKMDQLETAREYYRQFMLSNPSGEERRTAEQSLSEIERKLAGPATPEVPAPAATPAAASPALPVTPPPALPPSQAEPPPAAPTTAPAASSSVPTATDPASGVPTLVSPATPAAQDDSPLYTKWWLWAGVAVVAAGAVALFLFGPSLIGDGGRDGSWGAVTLP
jgi:hypothetical protein